MQNTEPFIPFKIKQHPAKELIKRTESFYKELCKRRSLRNFSTKAISVGVIENIIKTSSSAPSGANKQPWTFCAISNPEIKSKIRAAAEKEEYEFYHGRASDKWLNDLTPFGTNWQKPFLEDAPWLIVVFKKTYNQKGEGKSKNYYVQESVGIACGFLLAAIHHAGLVALTHTPSPMNFLQKILNRPRNEKPYLLIPVGYPAGDAKVPNITRKKLEEVAVFFE